MRIHKKNGGVAHCSRKIKRIKKFWDCIHIYGVDGLGGFLRDQSNGGLCVGQAMFKSQHSKDTLSGAPDLISEFSTELWFNKHR